MNHRVSVVVPCHNYGHYLGECLDSIFRQTRPPAEVIVVDDDSTDKTVKVVTQYPAVRYLKVKYNHPLPTRLAGIKTSRGDLVICVDADDKLSPAYIEYALPHFADPKVGIVYSDLAHFGDQSDVTSFPETATADYLARENCIHCGPVVRKIAYSVADAYSLPVLPHAHEDWLLWRRIVAAGYDAVKMSAAYRYRKHGSSLVTKRNDHSFFHRAALSLEKVTLFIPMSGRADCWMKLSKYLERQKWPHDQIKLVILDTTSNCDSSGFSYAVQHWLSQSDYSDYRYIHQRVGEPGLADADRTDQAVLRATNRAMAKIYNLFSRNLTTDYAWVLEDDVIPPDDALLRLFYAMDEKTASVSGAYAHRYREGFVAWAARPDVILKTAGTGVIRVAGNGFGCVLLRSSIVRNFVFSEQECYDTHFYGQLTDTAKLDWGVMCDHLSAMALVPTITGYVSQEDFDEDYYLIKHHDVRAIVYKHELTSGYEHFRRWGQAEGRTARKLEAKRANADSETQIRTG